MDKGNDSTETLYDVLKIRQDASDKDIRNSYVQLSKQFHPDVKGASNKQSSEQFLKIADAYQTLSKARTRREYDETLKAATQNMRIIEVGKSEKRIIHRPWEIKPNYDPNPGPYYGVSGLRKTTNFKVAAAIIFLGIAGGIFGFFSVKQSFTLNQERLDAISAKASEHHQRIRAEVNKSTREENVRRFVERLNRADR